MSLTVQYEYDLLTAIYDGPFEQPLWSSFLDRLRAHTRAAHAGLMVRPPERPSGAPIAFYSGSPLPPSLQERFRQPDHTQSSPSPLPTLQLRENRVYALGELVDGKSEREKAFAETVLAPASMRFLRMVRVREPDGVSAWMTIGNDVEDFVAADSSLLASLAPHLTRSLRAYVTIERERFRAEMSTQAIDRLNFGWISLDASGRILEMSAHAERLLSHTPILRKSRSGRLRATDPALEKELMSAIQACTKPGPIEQPHALRISRDPWLDMLLVPVRKHAETAPLAPAAIAYLQGDNRDTADRRDQIAQLFGLLPSEARVALALSRGLSIAETAAELGLTVETVRNYSKKIYAKTGARGQADLTRYILTSVLALA